MACSDPCVDDPERSEGLEVRWLRPGGIVAESLRVTVQTPQEASEGLARVWTALVEWRDTQLPQRQRQAIKDSLRGMEGQ